MDPHLEMKREKRGSSSIVSVHLVFLWSGDVYVGKVLDLHQGCQGPFQSSKEKVGFLLRCHSGNGPYLALRGESPGFSRVVAGNLEFLSSHDGDLRDPLVWLQERPVSMRVARGLSGLLSSQCRILGPHLQLRLQPQGSSPVLTWISGSYGISTGESGLISCGDMQICFPLKL